MILIFSRQFRFVVVLLVCTGLLMGCGLKKETLFSGQTMGTTYHVKVVTGYFARVSHLEKKISLCLEGINHSMSTYQKDSEISRFNSINDTSKTFKTTNDFFKVMRMAKELYQKTDGAWDATVDPLVTLWGFGREPSQFKVPDEKKIQAGLNKIGFDQIEILSDLTLKKRHPRITIDLASIAKGYGVDKVAEVLKKNQISDFLVEIGGEVYASGRRKDGQKWRVGINQPKKDAPINAVYAVVELENKSFATSGDYRNFFEVNGKRYSHIIDPRTGWPVDNGIVSVSILADNCAFADGLATAIMVMGPEKGQALLNRLDSIEGLILVEKSNGKIAEYASSGFQTALVEN